MVYLCNAMYGSGGTDGGGVDDADGGDEAMLMENESLTFDCHNEVSVEGASFQFIPWESGLRDLDEPYST